MAARPIGEGGEAAGHECVGRGDMRLALRTKVSLLLEVLKRLPDLGGCGKGAVISLRVTFLGPIVSDYLKRYPEVRLDLFCTGLVVDLVEPPWELGPLP